jgi:hypothetical protein
MIVRLRVDGHLTDVPDGSDVDVEGARSVRVSTLVVTTRELVSRPHQAEIAGGHELFSNYEFSGSVEPIKCTVAHKNGQDPPPRMHVRGRKSRRDYETLLPVVWPLLSDDKWRTFGGIAADVDVGWERSKLTMRLGWLMRSLCDQGYVEWRHRHYENRDVAPQHAPRLYRRASRSRTEESGRVEQVESLGEQGGPAAHPVG